MKRILLCLVVFALVGDVGLARGSRGCSASGCQVLTAPASEVKPPSQAPSYETSCPDLIAAVNKERVARGLKALVSDARLNKRATGWSVTMAGGRGMVHSGQGAENIAMGQRTVPEVMGAWMNSSGHRANILNRGYSRIGVGRCGNYWTQQFE